MSGRVFGEIPGVSVGRVFANREELSHSGVHRPTQAGISGAECEGADSIVLSGGYEDDEDLGDEIVYTGHGGQGRSSRKQVAHQELTRKNKALAVSMKERLPVRVVRGATHRSIFSPREGYRYDGLYTVERFWHDKGAAGFKVWRFSLIKQSKLPVSTEDPGQLTISLGNTNPGRIHRVVSRIARDSVLSGRIKLMYNFTCQVCAARLEGPAGPYVEAAHVRPPGSAPQRAGYGRQPGVLVSESSLSLSGVGMLAAA